MGYPRVSIVVLNWNRWEKVIRCLESLYQLTYPNYHVIILDNASDDGSVQKIKEWAQGTIITQNRYGQYNPNNKPIKIIELEESTLKSKDKAQASLATRELLLLIQTKENIGYLKAHNRCTAFAFDSLCSDYVLIIHNDTVTAPDFLTELMDAANREPNAGILGPKLSFYDDPDETWGEGRLLNHWMGPFWSGTSLEPKLIKNVKGEDVVKVDWLPMGCWLLSRKLYETVGLLDEAYVFGLDEMDISIRTNKRGLKVLYVPKSRIWHDGGRRSGYDEQTKSKLEYGSPYGHFLLIRKYWRGPQLITAIIFTIFFHIRASFLFLLHSRNWNHFKLYTKGSLDSLKKGFSLSRHP